MVARAIFELSGRSIGLAMTPAAEPVQVRVASAVGAEVQLRGHGHVVDRVVVPVQHRPRRRAQERGGIGQVELGGADGPPGPQQVDPRVGCQRRAP